MFLLTLAKRADQAYYGWWPPEGAMDPHSASGFLSTLGRLGMNPWSKHTPVYKKVRAYKGLALGIIKPNALQMRR